MYTLDAQGRPFSPSYEYTGRSDPRMRCSRETALSVKILAERASAKCSGNGVGFDLMRRYFVEDYSWWSFTEPEQRVIAKTARDFSRRLREAGFIEGKG
jgi:hypothetical protein